MQNLQAMRNKKVLSLLLLLLDLLVICTSQLVGVKGSDEKKFYIVYLGDRSVDEDSAVRKHIDLLSSVKESHDEAEKSLVYSYTKSFNAFAAKLSSDEANKLAEREEVLSVIPNRYRKLHTTRSWDFIGLPLTARRKFKAETKIVVALFDTGITPDSESFKDDGSLGPPPEKWKGICEDSANFSGCNNKIIGARHFKLDNNPDPSDILSPLDADGHGTHTSSTLAGDHVQDASLFGLAKGTSRGAVPAARVAVYKVCWISSGCSDMDILAAFEAAIHDGVDVISISIGGGSPDYTSDSISIGGFHAMKMGIITVTSAGNDGPSQGSVTNHAPWLVTVAASGIDRTFKSQVQFGNGKNILGRGISLFHPQRKMYPLVSGEDVARNSSSKEDARFCYEESLDSRKLKGKLVLCKLASWGTESVIKGLGGIGTIIDSDQYPDVAQIFMAPATVVNSTVGETIHSYIHSTSSATAVINKSYQLQVRAPFIASFSSRGPNPGTQRVLKPDIAAPGVDILASYTPLKSLTGLKGDTQFSKFTIMSGTSMACPHVAGAAAYVKSFHPHWSPAAIRSAILTTATPMSQRVNPEAEFVYGTGQLNPRRALNPGLVYDMNYMSYVQFLCLEGYPDSSIAKLIGSNQTVNCSSLIPGLGYDGLNYPTFQITLKGNQKTTFAIYRRTVTNVGPARAIYNATVRVPKGVEITVTPTRLVFTEAVRKRSFKVVVKAKWDPHMEGKMVSGRLAWKSSRYVVRSPIVVYSPYVDEDHDVVKVINENNIVL